MPHCDTLVAQGGAVGHIPLHPGNRKFGCQMIQKRIGDTHITFRIFKLDRINLMGHSG